MSTNVVLVIIVTSIATYLSRFLGVVSSTNIKENSKVFRWFNCLAYSTLAALISRVLVFPNGALLETSYLSRIMIVLFAIFIFYFTKKNLVYPTVFSAIALAILNFYF